MKKTNYCVAAVSDVWWSSRQRTKLTTDFGFSHLFCLFSKIVRITQALVSLAVVLTGLAILYGADQSNQVQY